MLSPFPRCRRRVLPSSCPGAVDGGGGVGDGFRAVGASGGLAVGAGGGLAVGAGGGLAVGAGGGTAVGASGGLAVGAGGGTAVGASRGTAVGASRGTEIVAGAGVGAEEAVFFALSLWLAVCSAISAVVIDLWLALP